jgi:hypothetical protein
VSAPGIAIDDVIDRVTAAHDGLVVAENWGERGLFYNPGERLPKGVYLLTFKEKDGPNDAASKVNRPGVYRLNLGIGKPTFVQRFGAVPARPAGGGVVDTGHDFTQLDRILPHPVYGWMAWVCVLNPSEPTFEELRPLIDEGYRLAVAKFEQRMRRKPRR